MWFAAPSRVKLGHTIGKRSEGDWMGPDSTAPQAVGVVSAVDVADGPVPHHTRVERAASPLVDGVANHWGIAAVVLQLALILLIVHFYEVASRLHFFPVFCAAVGGFVVHSCLPHRFRLSCSSGFCRSPWCSSCSGWSDGVTVIGLGAGLIAACYLPVPFGVRVTLVVLAAVVLAYYRLDPNQTFWPVLASMFMFRLIIYLYELRRERAHPPLALSVAYFFPLQNVCFLFFPIVDFKTFRDTYRAGAGWREARTGLSIWSAACRICCSIA